ncbi:MAG: 3'-5' exonuclease, partial [Erysipelotrichaceae bacterium]
NNYYETVCSHPQRTNLDLFLQKALSFEENNGNLPRFLELIEEIKDEKSSEAIPISLEDDVVRVMTIHQSKGLQFPVVYFWSSLRQNILDLTSELICDLDLGVALRSVLFPQRFVRKNPIRIAIETKAIQEEMEEQMRVLYVALTRPQNVLAIVDTKPKTPFTSALTRSSVFAKIGYSGWLASVMYGKQSHLFIESDVSGAQSEVKVPTGAARTVSFTPYPHPTLTTTYLTPSSQEFAFDPDFTLRYRDPLEGKARGTRLHSLIERLPLHDWTAEIIRNIDPTCTDDEVDSLKAFYASDFYTSARKARIEKEFPFALLEQDTVISGIIDMLAIYPDKVELMDFKADRFGTREQLIQRYQGQLSAYALALSKLFPGKIVYTFLYSLTLKQIIEVNHDYHT